MKSTRVQFNPILCKCLWLQSTFSFNTFYNLDKYYLQQTNTFGNLDKYILQCEYQGQLSPLLALIGFKHLHLNACTEPFDGTKYAPQFSYWQCISQTIHTCMSSFISQKILLMKYFSQHFFSNRLTIHNECGRGFL